MLKVIFWKKFREDTLSLIDHIKTFHIVVFSRIWPKFAKSRKFVPQTFCLLRLFSFSQEVIPSSHPAQVFIHEKLYVKLRENLVFFRELDSHCCLILQKHRCLLLLESFFIKQKKARVISLLHTKQHSR